jgi:hypothetical protein
MERTALRAASDAERSAMKLVASLSTIICFWKPL